MTDPRAVLKPGAVLERKRPIGGDPFDRLRVCGFATYDEGQTIEVIVQSASDFGPSYSTALEALDASYLLTEDGEPVRAWETSGLDLLTRRDSTITTTPPSAADGRKPDEPLAPSVVAYRKFKEGPTLTPKEQDQ